ncbi:unnamed protein product [Auanema sp. JU1783]|nr:unnamed protein product [Auanema sp. JU1783]
MGNAVSAANPTEILPVEYYLTDLGITSESLGSTRFMKVARGRSSSAGIRVYKVYLTPDGKNINESLITFGDEIIRIKTALSKAPNCSPFRNIYQKPKAVVLERLYQKYTLTDRLSTRPFINSEERLWYIFQIFKGLHQCSVANVCHGDIKSQNIALSSINWLQLTDFASFKPTFLPNDNPSHFTFFFDTSGKEVCNLAPERFLSSTLFDKKAKELGDKWMFGTLNHAMDIFSAGCVVYEMLNEGRSPFNYRQLCEFSRMNHCDAGVYLDKLLANTSSQFRPLLKMLLNQEPTMRMTAKEVLEGTALQFPSILESIFNYLNAFRPRENVQSQSIVELIPSSTNDFFEPDDVISKLKRDEDMICAKLEDCAETRPFAVLYITLITSNLRSLRYSQSKVNAMNLLLRLAPLCETSVSTFRILPYFVFFLNDENESIRAFAIHSIVDLIEPLEPSCFEDSLIFIDYLLPEFTSLFEKRRFSNTSCLLALAGNLGVIAQKAYKFLITGRSLRNETDDECSGIESLDSEQCDKEREALFKSIEDLFVSLSGEENCKTVRQALIQQHNLAALTDFFSKNSQGDLPYQHMITFLNSKCNWRLRAAFFESLPISLQKSSVVQPLLYQGMHDYEELVIIRVLYCVTLLCSAEMLDRNSVTEILQCASSFLAHPNDWIRFQVINLLVLLDSRWSLADNYCKVLSCVRDHFEGKGLMRFNHKVVAFNSLKPGISREHWNAVLTNLKNPEVAEFMRRIDDALVKSIPLTWTASWFAKNFDETQKKNFELLRCFRKFDLNKLIDSRKPDGMEAHLTMHRGVVDLSSSIYSHVSRNRYQLGKKDGSTPYEESFFGLQYRNSLCSSQLQELLEYKQLLYAVAGGTKNHQSEPKEQKESRDVSSISSTGTNPITLITHLHEHSDSVTQLSFYKPSSLFASGSRDGTVKIWSVKTVIGESYDAITSQNTYHVPLERSQQRNGTNISVDGLGWTAKGELGYFTSDGSFVWADVSRGVREVSKVTFPESDGPAKQMHVDGNLIFVRTHHNILYCLDSRVSESNGPLGKHEAWRRDISKNHGLITSFCIDPWQANWICMACTTYQLMLWDVRFQMEVNSRCASKDNNLPLKIWSNVRSPYQAPEVFVQFQYYGNISIFDLSQPTSNVSRVLWPSTSQPLGKHHSNGNKSSGNSQWSTTAILEDMRNITDALTVCEKTGAVFTGDTQGALRRWYPNSVDCLYLNGPRFIQERSPYRTTFREIGENPAVIHEVKVPNQANTERHIPPIEYKAANCHRTPITDIMVVENDYLVSSSSEGIIKVWK